MRAVTDGASWRFGGGALLGELTSAPSRAEADFFGGDLPLLAAILGNTVIRWSSR